MGGIEFWSLVNRRKTLILVVSASTVLLAGLYLLMVEPVYQASCKVLLVDEKDGSLAEDFILEDFMMTTLGKSDPILTQLEIIRTRPVIEEVIRICNVRDGKGELIRADRMVEKFQFEHIQSTNVLRIVCKDKSSSRAALFANTLAGVYLNQNQNMNRGKIIGVKRFLENQLILQKEKLEEAERAVIDFKTESNTVSLGEQTSMRVTALAELEAERIKLESELKGLQAQDAEIERRLALAGSQAVPGYSSLNRAKEQINISITNLGARLSAVRKQMNEKYRNMKDIPLLEIKLAKLEREEKIMREIFTTLLVKYEEYKIREAAQVGSIKIIEPAVPDDIPVYPRKKSSLALAVLTGLFLGLGSAFASEYIKDRPYGLEEVKKILKVSSLGAVPLIQKEKLLFMKDNPRSVPAEAVRMIQTNLKFKNAVCSEHVSLMVTSALPGEGKSVVTANLAVAFSNIGKRVALVSLDLRRPSFNRIFNRKFSKGVTDFLIGEVGLNGIMWSCDSVGNLTVVPGGSIPPNPTELSVSPRMNSMLEHLRSSFDVVLCDTAPITLVAETLEVARNMDGIIILTDFTKCSRKLLSSMQEMMEDKELPVLGFVVNKVGKEVGGRYSVYGYAYRESLSDSITM